MMDWEIGRKGFSACMYGIALVNAPWLWKDGVGTIKAAGAPDLIRKPPDPALPSTQVYRRVLSV